MTTSSTWVLRKGPPLTAPSGFSQTPRSSCSTAALLEPGQVLQVWRMAYRGLEESLQNREQVFSLLLLWKWKVKAGPSHRFVADAFTWRGSSKCSQSLIPHSLCETVVIWIVSFIFFPFKPPNLKKLVFKSKNLPCSLRCSQHSSLFPWERTYPSNPVYILNTNTSCC